MQFVLLVDFNFIQDFFKPILVDPLLHLNTIPNTANNLLPLVQRYYKKFTN